MTRKRMKAYLRRAVVTCVRQSLLLDIVYLSQQKGEKFDSCLREFLETTLHRCCRGRNRLSLTSLRIPHLKATARELLEVALHRCCRGRNQLSLTSLRIPRSKAAAKSFAPNLTLLGFYHAVPGHASAVQDFHYCFGA